MQPIAFPSAEPLPYEVNPPDYLNRSQIACWASICKLIRNEKPVFMWVVTTPENLTPDWVFAMRFGQFVCNLKDACRKRLIRPNWGGVRVFEITPKRDGHPLHAHLLMRGSMDFFVVQDCARRAGLGNIFRRPKACDFGAAPYLVRYLLKSEKIHEVKTWACIGTFNGVQANNVEFDSPRIRKIKRIRDMLMFNDPKLHRYAAYLRAVQLVSKGEAGL